MATRQRGRRPTPDQRKVRVHEKAIKAAQEERLERVAELDEATDKLAAAIEAAIDDSVATNSIGTWITSPDKPDGISRQMVYKLLSRGDTKPSSNGRPARKSAPRKRPGPPKGKT